MESKLIKVKTDGDILRDAYVISGLEIDGSEYVVYYIDRDDGENDNIFASKLINNNDGTYNMLNIENANEKINVTNTIKELIMKAIEDSEHDTLEGTSVTLRSKTVKLCPVLINKEQAIDIQKTYITTVKKSVTAVSKKYYGVQLKVESPVLQEEIFPTVETPQVVAATPEVQQPAGIVSSVTTASVVETPVVQTVPTVVEPVLPTLEVPQSTTPTVATPVVEPTVPVSPAPVVNVQTNTPVLDIPAGIISEPVVQTVAPVVASAPVVEQVVVQQPVVTPAVAPIIETPTVVAAPVVEPVQTVVTALPVQPTPVVQPANVVNPEPVAVVNPAPVVVAPTVVQPEPEKIVLDASKESNLNSALGEISKEAIAVADINAIKEFGEEDTPVASPVTNTVSPAVQTTTQTTPKVLTKKAGFANSKFFMFIAVGFFIASCIFMGYEAFNYYQIVK